MPFYPMSDYTLVKFQKSKTENKKYDAILKNKKSLMLKKISFGDSRYQQYRDNTGLGLYTHLNHNDIKRKKAYQIRHAEDMHEGFFSPGYFSMKYLWT